LTITPINYSATLPTPYPRPNTASYNPNIQTAGKLISSKLPPMVMLTPYLVDYGNS
jgi:hypothetical protein